MPGVGLVRKLSQIPHACDKSLALTPIRSSHGLGRELCYWACSHWHHIELNSGDFQKDISCTEMLQELDLAQDVLKVEKHSLLNWA